MSKRLIKCSSCKHTFFTNKVMLSESEIKQEQVRLDKELKDFTKYLNDLEVQKALIEAKIKKTKDEVKQIKKDQDELNTTVQCSECGTRLNALDNEVKT